MTYFGIDLTLKPAILSVLPRLWIHLALAIIFFSVKMDRVRVGLLQ